MMPRKQLGAPEEHPATSLTPDHPLVVACAADERFARPLAVALFSLLSNYRGSLILKIYIVDGGMRPASRSRVERVLGGFGVASEWLAPNWRPVEHLIVSERFPRSIYLRLMIPELLPKDYKKAIYLDSDVLVEEDISKLWDYSTFQRSLLAVQDDGCPTVGSQWGLPNYAELSLEPDTMYFNSGVLVFDLERWRERQITARIIKYVETCAHHMRFVEQEAMNAVLIDDWGALDRRWNQLVSPWEGHNRKRYERGILHFVSPHKPWTPKGVHWTNPLYDGYLRRSGWYRMLSWWQFYLPLTVQRAFVRWARAHVARTTAH